MTTIAAPEAEQTDTRSTLLAYLEALTLAEPLQERIWQLAQLTLTQVSVLRELRDEPKTAGKLGQAVGLSPTSVTRLVDRLERRGLVSRHRAVEAMTRDERRNLTTGLRRLVELTRDIAARDEERG